MTRLAAVESRSFKGEQEPGLSDSRPGELRVVGQKPRDLPLDGRDAEGDHRRLALLPHRLPVAVQVRGALPRSPRTEPRGHPDPRVAYGPSDSPAPGRGVPADDGEEVAEQALAVALALLGMELHARDRAARDGRRELLRSVHGPRRDLS